MAMRRTVARLLVCGALLAGCSEAEESGGTGGTGGTGGKGGSGGSTGSGGSAGSGSGGSAGSSGSGGASAGQTGGTSGSGGSAGSGGAGGTGTAGTGGAGGTAGSGGSGGSKPADGGPSDATSAGDVNPASAGTAPYGCTNCKRIFDGKTLDGWETRGEGAWVARDGILASTGKADDIWTKADYGDFRIFFQVRQERGNHKPDTLFFGTRPAPGAQPRRGLGGAQFQPPNGGSWNYGAGGTFNRPMNPNFNVNNWHQCEVLVKEVGSFKAACCPVAGTTPCKGVLVLTWMGKGKKAPFGIQMHNPGLFDEYKELWVEENPTGDELLSMK